MFLVSIIVTTRNTHQETDTATTKVKIGKYKFNCKFEIVHQDSQILLDQSSVSCTPKKPSRKKAVNIRVKGSSGLNYTANILINPDVLSDVVVGKTHNSLFIT